MPRKKKPPERVFIVDGHRDTNQPRVTNVKGVLCPGIWVEDPQVTMSRNVNTLLKKWKRNGMSQAEFAKQSGISLTTLRLMRMGQVWPEPGTLMKVASTFGVPIEVLFRR